MDIPRFNPLPPSMSTLVSRKPSTIGLRTSAAGARAVRNLGPSMALKVIAVSLHGFITVCGRFRPCYGVFACAYYLTRRSQRLLTPYCYPWDGALWHLWYCIRCTMNFAGSVKPSLQYGSMPCRGFLFLCNYLGCLMIVHPFTSDWVYIRSRIIPKFHFGFPGAFHRTVLSYYGRQVSEA